MSPAISNFLKVYSQAVFRISNLGIFGFGVILAVIFWQLFVPILSIFTLGILIFSLKVAVSRDFINQTLSNKKTFQIQDLITILKEHLNKPYLTETKLNFQNAKHELVGIQKNLEIIAKKPQISNSSLANYEMEELKLEKLLPEMIEKVINLSFEEQKIRRFLQTENEAKLKSEIEILEQKVLEQKNNEEVLNSESESILQSKKNQLEMIKSYQEKVIKIDDYLEQINAKLTAIRIFTAKMGMQSDDLMTANDSLFSNIEKLTLEINLFEQEMNK